MAQERYVPEEQPDFDRDVQIRAEEELRRVREEEYKAAVERAATARVEQQREMLREELQSEVADTSTESAGDRREEASREAPSKLMLAIVLLILLLFIMAITGRLSLFRGASADANAAANAASGTGSANGAFQPILGGAQATPVGGGAAQAVQNGAANPVGRGLPNAGGVDGVNSIPSLDPNINPLFAQYYLERDGLRVFGLPISPLVTVNGRQVQWFERTRLEYWPEYEDTPYRIQSGLVGLEYTDGRDFPTQAFFTSRPGLRFFPETSHGVGGKFLEYYDAHGGLEVLGYPISDEITEVLPETKQYYTVQYFQRARLEWHREYAGTEDEVQLGLLGRALYLNEAKSQPVPLVAPTAVPLP